MCTEIKQIAGALSKGDMKRIGQIRRDHISNSLSRIQRYLGEGHGDQQHTDLDINIGR
jgi:hypothetical protein